MFPPGYCDVWAEDLTLENNPWDEVTSGLAKGIVCSSGRNKFAC